VSGSACIWCLKNAKGKGYVIWQIFQALAVQGVQTATSLVTGTVSSICGRVASCLYFDALRVRHECIIQGV